MPRRLPWLAAPLALLALVACSESSPSPPPPPPPMPTDGAIPGDGPGPVGDFGGDGLCDATETARGTDPRVADTDEDGFPDGVEVRLSFDPLMPTSPDRDLVFLLRESEASAVQIPIEAVVRGEGEDFSGAFEAVGSPDLAGTTAATFYQSSVAVFAEPPDAVAQIDEDAETFRGVVGTTLLGFELRLAFGGATPRLCARAYPFRYNVKRSDGTIVSIDRMTVLVLPPGERLETTEWCVPEACL